MLESPICEKAPRPITVSVELGENVTAVNPLKPKNAKLPIVETDAGMFMDVIWLLAKADSPISLTELGTTYEDAVELVG